MREIINNKKRVYAVIILALFNFIFLGTEYLFDNMMKYVTDSKGVVIAQSYILGASVLGFIIFPFIKGCVKSKVPYIGSILAVAGYIGGVLIIVMHFSYVLILIAGCLIFVLLGIIGSLTHYLVAINLFKDGSLAKTIGFSYAIGLYLQFINNNLINNDRAEAVVLSVMMIIWLAVILSYALKKPEDIVSVTGQNQDIFKKPKVAAITLIFQVLFMACIFSTLDNVVTLFHSTGKVDIGQLPRLLLAVSGILAGILFDMGKRRYMSIIMYCVTLLSTICVLVIMTGGRFMVGLIVFYLSAGFFAVFFTTAFIELSFHMKKMELWAGLGRGVNNLCAAIIGTLSINLIETKSVFVNSIVALVMFVLISLSIFIYYMQNGIRQDMESIEPQKEDLKDKFIKFSETFSLTPREKEVMMKLLTSDKSVQDIAGELYISRAALYRHIANLNEKTGTKSRVGLIQFYYEWK